MGNAHDTFNPSEITVADYRIAPDTGIFTDLSNESYHADSAISRLYNKGKKLMNHSATCEITAENIDKLTWQAKVDLLKKIVEGAISLDEVNNDL